VPDNFVEWAKTLAVQFRTEGATEELIEGVAAFDHKVRALARETTEPGSRSSPSKRSKGKSAAAAATTKSVVNLDPGDAPLSEDEDAVSWSSSDHVDPDEEEDREDEDDDESRGRSGRPILPGSLRGRSLSPRLCELVGRAFIQYLR
jgi:hypothetical protein